ncbi:transporter [Mangrovimonas yunxiaonensis]|uniref:Transporter n=1 Tax=Mangrovimonas yunxiaonensis TaxID=1197477 RepID=A0A084TJS6_9FLAO|nr:TolC family protein [Mangrovimonas yunxiaonensis]KFB00962.1 transporter [Mangrovimonas yunxiaonensis]GGH43356.1 transporter [Mangrovimonas yunxiaonensis]
MKTFLLYSLLVCTTFLGYSQNTLSLEACYAHLETHYPLAQQRTILDQQEAAERSAIKAKTRPQLNLNAQATYLSDVTQVPIPNTGIAPLNNDQYRATLSANQLIYNGGKIKATTYLQHITTDKKKKAVEVSLYQLKQHVNQLYFAILLSVDQIELLELRRVQLESTLTEVKSGVKNGVLLPTSEKNIETELLRILQQTTEANNNKTKFIAALAALTGTSIHAETQFEKPLVTTTAEGTLNRPEIGLFSLQKQEIEQQKNLLSKTVLPELSGFATGGYGNPGLNMLENDFKTFYMLGLQLNWKVFDWNSNKNKRQALEVSKALVDSEEAVFRLNTNIALNDQKKDIETLENTLLIDQQLIALQKEIVAASNAQLKNGVITTADYTTQLTKLYEAENLFNQHKTQLQLAKANYNVIKGLNN